MKLRKLVAAFRSAVTGRYVTRDYALLYPRLTVREECRRAGHSVSHMSDPPACSRCGETL